jgi:outer membrane protein assembly factor BamA
VAQPQVAWPDAIGPMVDYVLADAPTRWVATGGDARAMTTIELLFPLSALGLGAWDGYSAALFSDIGNTWLLSDLATASSDSEAVRAVYQPVVRYSAGAGVRIATPIGPLQVDVAVNPDALFATDDRRLLLRGAWEEPSVRAHLSLGTLW